MVWYGMVWYGMVWYGTVWYGMVCMYVCVYACVYADGVRVACVCVFANMSVIKVLRVLYYMYACVSVCMSMHACVHAL